MPGEASGRMSVKAKAPAVPAEAPAAGPSRSRTATACPRACAASATDRPMTPAPTTITCLAIPDPVSVRGRQELPQLRILRCPEQFFGRGDLRHHALVKKCYAVRNFPGELHFVRDADHGHPLRSQHPERVQ